VIKQRTINWAWNAEKHGEIGSSDIFWLGNIKQIQVKMEVKY
jgi:hypothetical protein